MFDQYREQARRDGENHAQRETGDVPVVMSMGKIDVAAIEAALADSD